MAWVPPVIGPVPLPVPTGEDIFAHPLPDNKPQLLSIRKSLVSMATRSGPYTNNEHCYYQLEFSEPIRNSIDILTRDEIPQWGTKMDGNYKLFVVDYRIHQNPSAPQVYDLEVIYGNSYSNAGLIRLAQSYKPVDNPVDRPAEIEWGTYRTRELISIDQNGKPITTTAGEPIIHEEEISRRVLHVQVNIAGLHPLFANSGDYINIDKVKLFTPAGPILYDPLTWWITDIKVGKEELDGSTFYYPLSFSCYHRAETWIVRKRNVGYMQLLPSVTTSINAAGAKVYDPVRMNYSPIKVGNPPQFTRTPLPLRNTDKQGFLPSLGSGPSTGYPLMGTLFPEYSVLDPVTGQQIDPSKVTLTPDRLKEIWKEAEILFDVKKCIYFANKSPKYQKTAIFLNDQPVFQGGTTTGSVVIQNVLTDPGIQSPVPDGIFFPA